MEMIISSTENPKLQKLLKKMSLGILEGFSYLPKGAKEAIALCKIQEDKDFEASSECVSVRMEIEVTVDLHGFTGLLSYCEGYSYQVNPLGSDNTENQAKEYFTNNFYRMIRRIEENLQAESARLALLLPKTK